MPPSAQKNLESGGRVKAWTSVAADVDLTTAYQGYTQGDKPLPARWLVYSGGDLVVEDLNGDSTTLPAALGGVPFPGQFTALVSAGTTATAIVAIW